MTEREKHSCAGSYRHAVAGAIAAALMASVGPAPARAQQAPCLNAAPYVAPDDVELGDAVAPGQVPADLSPSPIKKALPQTYHFPLAVDPLPERLPNSSIELGDIGIDARTGRSTLNGAPLGKNDAADAAAGCMQSQKGAR